MCSCVCTSSVVSDAVTPWIVARQAPLPIEFSRKEYWSGLPFPPLGDLPNPGIEPASLNSLVLADWFFTNWATWEALCVKMSKYFFLSKTWVPPAFKINRINLLALWYLVNLLRYLLWAYFPYYNWCMEETLTENTQEKKERKGRKRQTHRQIDR